MVTRASCEFNFIEFQVFMVAIKILQGDSLSLKKG